MTHDVERIDPAEALMREVGAQLRRVRLERGEELEAVAETLRIKPTYLYGIEQGDLSVMPGRTYALGFLRSYADYLGFDGDDLIIQIKSTVDDLTDSARLHIRTPLPESRLPKTPLVLLSLAVVAGIYAGWSYLHYSGELGVETVAEVPENLRRLAFDRLPTPAEPNAAPQPVPAEEAPPPAPATEADPEPEGARPGDDAAGPGGLVAGEGQAASPPEAPTVTFDQPAEPEPATATPEVAPGSEEVVVAEAAEEPAATASPAPDALDETRLSALEPRAGPDSEDEGVPSTEGDADVAEPEPVDQAEAAPEEPPIPEERPVAEPAAAADDDPVPEEIEPAAVEPDPAAAVEDEEPAPPTWPGAAEVLALHGIDLEEAIAAGTPEDPVIHEPQNTDARIILRGIGTSWIRIESESGDYLRTRTLDLGDAFLVPDRDDLIMWTGNAGGIEVIVDGEVLPPLSTDGAVVRDIPLNPADLPAFVTAGQ